MNIPATTRIRSVDLPATVDAPAAIRAFLRAALPSSPPEATAVVELLTTELVSNVVRHVESPMTVRVAREGRAVRVEVDDDSATTPVLLNPALDAPSGRGLFLVDSLASDWGWSPRDNGKTVWFVVALEDDPEDVPDAAASTG